MFYDGKQPNGWIRGKHATKNEIKGGWKTRGRIWISNSKIFRRGNLVIFDRNLPDFDKDDNVFSRCFSRLYHTNNQRTLENHRN